MPDFVLVGIDTGIRNSLGVVFLKLSFDNFRVKSFFTESFRKKSFLKNAKEKRKFLGILIHERLIQLSPLFGSVYSFYTKDRKTVTKVILESIKLVEESKEKVKIVVEDFLFFGKNGKKLSCFSGKTASWFTVAKIQNAIGYLVGFFTANDYDVKVVKPKTWKSISDPFYKKIGIEVIQKVFLSSIQLRPSEGDHILSATGISLSCIPDLVIKNL